MAYLENQKTVHASQMQDVYTSILDADIPKWRLGRVPEAPWDKGGTQASQKETVISVQSKVDVIGKAILSVFWGTS